MVKKNSINSEMNNFFFQRLHFEEYFQQNKFRGRRDKNRDSLKYWGEGAENPAKIVTHASPRI